MREGNIIKDGFSEEVDRLRHAKLDGKKWLAKLEEDEGKIQALRTSKSNITVYSDIILKLPIHIKSLFLTHG